MAPEEMSDREKEAYFIVNAIDDWVGHRKTKPRKLFWVFRNPLTHDEFYQGLGFIQL